MGKKKKLKSKTENLIRKYNKGHTLQEVDLSHQLLHLNLIPEVFVLHLKKTL